ncbi:RDD family protein [Streptomyces sp. FIT100]|uniref:RDD family protein n=1 Tax=Streptomyces sp. FIT100 TaxID=2837956 RepID=UPI0021C9C6F8|nr:RDD family protein [Streptomyces sp. FIT100]UUN27138.1 RDD family protein [Streptomyces sp. FIT100]
MSNDQPPGPPPEDDPFRKKPQEPQGPEGTPGTQGPQGPQGPWGPQEPTPPPGGSPPPPGGGPYGAPPPGSPYGAPPPGSPYGAPPPPYDAGPYSSSPYGGEADPLRGMPPLADPGKRILARIIDWLIVLIPLALIGIPFGIYDGITEQSNDFDELVTNVNTGSQWIFQIISIIAYVGYDTLMVRRTGQTIGKKLMKLRVAMLQDGSTPDTGSSLMRAAVLWLPQLICCPCLWPLILLIMILVDKPYRQGLHDKAAKTVVVSTTQ